VIVFVKDASSDDASTTENSIQKHYPSLGIRAVV
jgi:hypothetical protein